MYIEEDAIFFCNLFYLNIEYTNTTIDTENALF